MDRIYTPPPLASLLVDAARAVRPRLIADFAAGDGALLRAANRRWPEASLFGSDIDPGAVKAMAVLPSLGRAVEYDFLEQAAPGPLTDLEARCDIVLLNPPFSGRGNRRHFADLNGCRHSGSKALAFVARALRFLSRQGELLAIIPSSCLTSERDAALLDAIESDYDVARIGELHRDAFGPHAVSVALVRVRRRARPRGRKPTSPSPPALVRPFQVAMMRGSLPVHRAVHDEAGVPYVHTSDLRSLGGAVLKTVMRPRRVVDGPAVLLARVGRPDRAKLVLIGAGGVALSDCVVALRTEPRGHEAELLNLLSLNWARIERLYGGSCAPYLTMESLLGLLGRLGLQARRVESMYDDVEGRRDQTVESWLRTG